MERQEGFYWVKQGKAWSVGFLSKSYVCQYPPKQEIVHYDWMIIGSDEYYDDDDFDEIGPKMEQPPHAGTS
jgi:hypothetical protein